MIVLDRAKILDFMKKRKDALYNQITRDFGGGLGGREKEHSEVKFWKEAIERGEFDTDIKEVYVILSATRPEIVDFTFYTDKETVENRVGDLNKLAKRREYWWITMYPNSRNLEKDGERVPKNI